MKLLDVFLDLSKHSVALRPAVFIMNLCSLHTCLTLSRSGSTEMNTGWMRAPVAFSVWQVHQWFWTAMCTLE